MNSLRIAIFTPTFLPKCSGAEVFHHNLAVRLAAAGHGVTVIAPRNYVRQLRLQGWRLPYDLVPYPAKRLQRIRHNGRLAFWLNRRALSSLQRKHRFDVWHAFVLYPAGAVFADWQRHSRVPGLVRAVGDDVSGLPSRGHDPHVGAAIRAKLPHAQAVVALSGEMADELAGLGIAPEKIRVISNAVAAARFSPSPAARKSARAELGVSDSAFVFLCVARNHPQKDFPTLFAAFRELCALFPDRDIRLVIVGRNAKELSSQAGPPGDGVHLCEFGADKAAREVPEMPPQKLVNLYLASDTFVLCSLLEGFSSAIVEAMAAGLPLVVTDAPGIRGVVTDGKEGLMVPVHSPAALAAAMKSLYEDANLRARMSLNARATASGYDWPSVVASYESLYRELIAGRPEK